MDGYCSSVVHALSSENAGALSSALSLLQNNFSINIEDGQLEQKASQHFRQFGPNVVEMITNFIKCRKALMNKDPVEAYKHQIQGVVKFQEVFRKGTNWLVPTLHVLTFETRIVAMRADQAQSVKNGKECHDSLRNAEQHLKKGFSLAMNDRAPLQQSKKLGALYVVNQLFKIYFKLNTIRLCRNLIRAVEGPAFPALDQFQKRDLVTYHFYVGRIAMFEDDYRKAESCLDVAAQHCPNSCVKNKRLILQFLIPVKMLLGLMPSPELLKRYRFEEFYQLVEAIKMGNIKRFIETIDQYQDQFVQQGVYLLVEKLRIITYRNLFKKVFLVVNAPRVKLQDFQLGMQLSSGEVPDLHQVECILANLIYAGYVKGYISHQMSVVVLSKKEPFPRIDKVAQ